MTLSGDINMAIDIVNNLFKKSYNNYDKMRDHLITSNTQSPRTLSMFSSECDEEYFARVQCKSDNMVEDNQIIPFDNPQLEYATSNSQDNQVSKVTNYTTNTRQQYVKCDASALNNNMADNNNVFNIQLQHDIN